MSLLNNKQAIVMNKIDYPRWKNFLGFCMAVITPCLLLISENSIAQAPVISYVTPSLRIPGMADTIHGTNFNPIAGNNVVFYGATQASVTGVSSDTALFVTVPAGALYAPVSVMNSASHLMGYEPKPFTPEFDNSCFIPAQFNFKPKVDYNTSGAATNPYIAAIGDVDGDGKPDLVVANYGSNKAMILKNAMTTTGTITSSSFVVADSVSFSGSPANIKLADLDGDGKLDIIAAIHNSTSVNISRNTSTGVGSFSFSGRSTYVISAVSIPVSYEIVTADFDGDGKTDIGVVNQGADSFSVLPNTISAPGAFSAASFAHWKGFYTGSAAINGPVSAACGDLDGDGKPDVVVSNEYVGSVSVLRNTSSSGNITFGTHTDFSVASASTFAFQVEIADIDLDGKQDVLVACTNVSATSPVNYLTVLRNTSTSVGSVSFAGHSDFATGNYNSIGLDVGDLDGDGKIDVAVTNNASNNITLFRNTSTSGTITLTATSTLSTGTAPIGVAIGDLDGDHMPDITVANNGTNTISVLKNYPLPKLDTISGATAICISGTVIDTFKDSISGGVWSVTNSHASINSTTGRVTAVTAGTDTVIYTLICNGDTSVVSKAFTISSAVSAGTISGPSTVCAANIIALTDAIAGGTWGVTAATSSYASVSSTGMVTGTSSGTAQITYSVTNSCGTATATHNVSVSPAAGAITGASSVCSGASTTLHTTSVGGTWASTNYPVASVGSTTGVVTGGTPGLDTIIYTAPGGCYTMTPITVYASPAGISGSGSVCYGLSTTLTDATAGSWSSANSSIASIDPSTGVVTGVATGTTSIIYTSSANSCTATRTFVVNPLPAAISVPGSVCVGSNLALSDASSPGSWTSTTTGVATVVSTGASSASLHGLSAGTTLITYTLSATGCIDTATVTVNPTPTAITGNSAVCVNSVDTLMESTPGGTWSSSSSGIASVSSTGMVTGISSGSAVLSYTLSGTSCRATFPVTVNALPAGITGSTPICPGHSITMHDATSGGGWTVTNTSIATIGSGTGVFTATPGGFGGLETVVYTLFATSCSTSTTVYIFPAPAPITGYDTVCNTLSLTLSDATTTGYWSSASPSIATIDSGTGLVTGLSAGTAIISYTDTVTAGHCASILSFTVDPVVTPSLSITTSPSTTVCAETPVMYTANPVNGGTTPTYVWQVNGVVTGTGPTFHYTPANSDVVECTMTTSVPCVTSTTAVTSLIMTVHPLATPSVTLATSFGRDTICSGSSTLITPNPVNGGTSPSFRWEVNGVPVWSGATWTYVPTNGDVVTVVMTSNVACPAVDTATDTLVLTVSNYLTPSVTFTGSDTACAGYPSTFVAVPVNGGVSPTYRWSLNTINVASGDVFTYSATTGDVVSVTMTSDFPCLTTPSVTATPRTMTVIDVPMPAVSVEIFPGTIVTAGTPVYLIAHPVNGGLAPTYTWYDNGIPVYTSTDSTYDTNTYPAHDSMVCKLTNNQYCDGISAFGYVIFDIGDNVGVSQVNMANANVAMQPNPNNGTFTITGNLASATSDAVEMEITNVLGQVVYKETIDAVNGKLNSKVTLDAALGNGLYLLNVHSPHISKVIRFDLER